MARSLDVILVVDVESACWEAEPPEGQVSEIIEIGLCTVDVKSLTDLRNAASWSSLYFGKSVPSVQS